MDGPRNGCQHDRPDGRRKNVASARRAAGYSCRWLGLRGRRGPDKEFQLIPIHSKREEREGRGVDPFVGVTGLFRFSIRPLTTGGFHRHGSGRTRGKRSRLWRELGWLGLMSVVQINVWSDYVCPFCYLAEPPLARVVAESNGAVTIRWRAFELRPEPEPTLDPQGDYLRDIWARAVYPMAKARGMVLHLPPLQPRSRMAHEAAAYAAEHGQAAAMPHALFRAFFEAGADIGDIDVVTQLGAGIGLDAANLRHALVSGRYRPGVIEDERLAASFGLSGVPAIVVRAHGAPWNEAVLVEGAQPYEVIGAAVAQVRARIG
jgi:predicted DsbA family dithiol-disulfide isomerase